MAIFDEAGRKRLSQQLQGSFDADNAGDLDAFARNFLHNSALWDAIADHYPTASASAVRGIMMEAYAAWQAGRTPAED